MSRSRFLLLGAASVILLVFVVSWFLPTTTQVERAIDIHAPRVVIFDQVNNVKGWQAWDPWVASDSSIVVTFPAENDFGIGAVRVWTTVNGMGDGRFTIVDSREPELVRMELDYGSDKASYRFLLEEAEHVTRVTWLFEMELGWSPMRKILGLTVESGIGPAMEDGLQHLKMHCESENMVPS